MKRVYVSDGRDRDMIRQRSSVEGEEGGSLEHYRTHGNVMENEESNNFLELDSR